MPLFCLFFWLVNTVSAFPGGGGMMMRRAGGGGPIQSLVGSEPSGRHDDNQPSSNRLLQPQGSMVSSGTQDAFVATMPPAYLQEQLNLNRENDGDRPQMSTKKAAEADVNLDIQAVMAAQETPEQLRADIELYKKLLADTEKIAGQTS